jgi:hypothetical protein
MARVGVRRGKQVNADDTGFQFHRLAVSPSSVTVTSSIPNLLGGGFANQIDYDDGRVVSTGGSVADPEAGRRLGTFYASGLVVSDSGADRARHHGPGTQWIDEHHR